MENQENIGIKIVLAELSRLEDSLKEASSLARIIACVGVWQCFDKLRSEDRPFDRLKFVHTVRQAADWAPRWADKQGADSGQYPAEIGDVERFTGSLYAKSWVAYDQEEFLETTNFFEQRLRNNGVDVAFIRGARCLDAGCGGGRYAIALHNMGASFVNGIDISEEAIEDAIKRRNAYRMPEEQVTFNVGSVLALPEDWSNRFDFIISNGVLHHTVDPILGLAETFRVLKKGGSAFIYVYGSGGLHWEMVDFVRRVLYAVSDVDVRNVLHLLDLPVGKIFHIMDHWFVPNYETITREEFERRLGSAGFTQCQYLPRGLFLYDSSERLWRYPEDRDLMGEGDLRYMVKK